jgi:hypothetical protein
LIKSTALSLNCMSSSRIASKEFIERRHQSNAAKILRYYCAESLMDREFRLIAGPEIRLQSRSFCRLQLIECRCQCFESSISPHHRKVFTKNRNKISALRIAPGRFWQSNWTVFARDLVTSVGAGGR